MPQMKPMNWLLLLLYFTIMFIFMNNTLYFFNYKKFMLNKINNNNLKYMKFKFKW
uniref:ATP synthase F0 subunit 8 n=1 Tax=Andricus mairei TaxID=1100877 RepID=UPI00226D1089|nr:ATP synthase F0 subunit 8 [Andricus mairei]UZI00034.1 ATP synthase F0 subunit 8 [Andricus mairei]UZN92503.1 ATP synthase F0 subunit 8 [Andricus mairei]